LAFNVVIRVNNAEAGQRLGRGKKMYHQVAP